MNRRSRGQIRIIEAFLAVMVIFSAFTASANLAPGRKVSDSSDLSSAGMQALAALDSEGSLGAYIDNENWTALIRALDILLPVSISFNLTVYDKQGQQINGELVSNGGFSGREVASVQYVCACRSPIFHAYIVHMALAVAT